MPGCRWATPALSAIRFRPRLASGSTLRLVALPWLWLPGWRPSRLRTPPVRGSGVLQQRPLSSRNPSRQLRDQSSEPTAARVHSGGHRPRQEAKGVSADSARADQRHGAEPSGGDVSMARGAPDSATSDFFILLNDQPSLAFGGERFDDGQGAAAFGRVVSGMDVVRKTQQQSTSGRASRRRSRSSAPNASSHRDRRPEGLHYFLFYPSDPPALSASRAAFHLPDPVIGNMAPVWSR